LAAIGEAGGAIAPVSPVPGASPDQPNLLAGVTERALRQAGRLDSPLGSITMIIASRLGQYSMLDTAAGVVALSRELDRLLTIALTGAEEPDELDELERRRRLKAARAGV
jgi:hypothetical protein